MKRVEVIQYAIYLFLTLVFLAWYFVPGSIDTNAFVAVFMVGLVSLMWGESRGALVSPKEVRTNALRESQEMEATSEEQAEADVVLEPACGRGDSNVFPDDELVCRYKVDEVQFGDWVGLYRKNVMQWEYVHRRCVFVHGNEGEVTFSGGKSAHFPGEYQFRYHRQRTAPPLPSSPMGRRVQDLVQDSPIEKLTQNVVLPNTSITLGSSAAFHVRAPELIVSTPDAEESGAVWHGAELHVKYVASALHSKKDWIGLYRTGTPNGNTHGKWTYAPGPTGVLVFAGERAPPTPGRYEFRMHRDDGFEVLSTSRQVVVLGPSIDVLFREPGADVFEASESVEASYVTSKHRSSGDWIEVHREGSAQGEYKGPRYAVEQEKGTVHTPLDGFPPGKYEYWYHAVIEDATLVLYRSAPFFVK
eukprot:TRINITY_DN8083_c0_g1_i2.p1 TRINITY_DN8083_c0_g1~~TRINITY_DN8083_c0_g1_i2.p1  ORF type:complete len:468 (-),score=138.24 TRINITY_DN8083_c0_g1_i2:135-1382(-)